MARALDPEPTSHLRPRPNGFHRKPTQSNGSPQAARVSTRTPRVLPSAKSQITNHKSPILHRSDTALDLLLKLTATADFFVAPGPDPHSEPSAWAHVAVDGQLHTFPVASPAFRHWLTNQYWHQHAHAPHLIALYNAIAILAQRTLREAPRCPLAIRLAQVAQTIYLDLANPAGDLIAITPEGWSLVSPGKSELGPLSNPAFKPTDAVYSRLPWDSSHPHEVIQNSEIPNPKSEHQTPSRAGEYPAPAGIDVSPNPADTAAAPSAKSKISNHQSQIPLFLRPPGQLPIPTPALVPAANPQIQNSKFQIPNSSISSLRSFVNLPDDNSFILLVAWLVAALRPGAPCPILAITGQPGSGKSTLACLACCLIDPHSKPLQPPPPGSQLPTALLPGAGAGGRVLALDNLTHMPHPLADALASLASAARAHGQPARPIILTSVDDLALHPHLIQRTIHLRLPPLEDGRRLPESRLWSEFEARRPAVLGALPDAVSLALRGFDRVPAEGKPPLGDFVRWVEAAEPCLPWAPGAFLAAYRGAHVAAARTVAAEEPLAIALLLLLEHSGGSGGSGGSWGSGSGSGGGAGGGLWRGTVLQLLLTLNSINLCCSLRRESTWPRSARALSAQLRRLSSYLPRIGAQVEFGPHTAVGTFVIVRSTPPAQPPDPAGAALHPPTPGPAPAQGHPPTPAPAPGGPAADGCPQPSATVSQPSAFNDQPKKDL